MVNKTKEDEKEEIEYMGHHIMTWKQDHVLRMVDIDKLKEYYFEVDGNGNEVLRMKGQDDPIMMFTKIEMDVIEKDDHVFLHIHQDVMEWDKEAKKWVKIKQ